jgi:nucleoid-associated protein YgaU
MALSNPINSSFGETPNYSSRVKGSERVLAITEMKRVGAGGFGATSLQPTGVEFKFAKENFSAPRGPQSFGVELRTARQDLPGSEEPVEQVLGWHYTPFTVTGVWDDRYAGKGYAEKTRNDFQEMVKRGNIVKYQFEQVSVYGLIKNFTTNYKRQDLQGYSFTISPHYRTEGETVRENANPNRKVVQDPKTSVLKARAALDALRAAQALATAAANARVQSLISGSIFSDINDAIDTVETHIANAENIVNNEILKPGQDAANALNRGAQAMASVKTAASAILSQTRHIAASTLMSVDSISETLKLESWGRGVASFTRDLVVQAEQSRIDFVYRAQPKPARLHRVRQGESLYQISTLYYGTPHHWRDILTANHLTSIVLLGGELLVIPNL